jgi:HD-GYP domain-containing protein (c-di-GMP phosphodiesterase class II)
MKKRKISFRLSITCIMLLMTISLSIILSLSAQSIGRESAILSAKSMFSDVVRHLSRDLQAFFDRVGSLCEVASASPGLDDPAVSGDIANDRVRFFMAILEKNKSICSLYLGFKNGDFLQVISLANAPHMRQAYQSLPEAATLTRTIVRENGRRTQRWMFYDAANALVEERVEEDVAYDPRHRPWYLQAMHDQKTIFTRPYVFSSSREPGITCARPLPSEQAVLGIDISIVNLSQLLTVERLEEAPSIFLMDGQNRLVAPAFGHEAGAVASTADVLRLPLVADSPDPLVRKAAALLGSGALTDDGHLLVALGGKTFLAMTATIGRFYGETLHVVFLSPLDNFTGHLRHLASLQALYTLAAVGVFIVIILFVSREIAKSLNKVAADAERVSRFDFTSQAAYDSSIKEIHVLIESVQNMRSTIEQYTGELLDTQAQLEKIVEKGIALSAEKETTRLVEMLFQSATELTDAQGGILFLKNGDTMVIEIVRSSAHGLMLGGESGKPILVPPLALCDDDGSPDVRRNPVCVCMARGESISIDNMAADTSYIPYDLCDIAPEICVMSVSAVFVPLKNRHGEALGVIQLVNSVDLQTGDIVPFSPSQVRFTESLASQAGVALENQQLYESTRQLLDSFIMLIAGAIDAKSSYTGAHCSRVPRLAIRLADAAHASTAPPFRDFSFADAEHRKEFEIAAWLHDCGKVTTPEYVMDKATKLETISNRIHEIRTRFEVLLRDAEIDYYRKLLAGGADAAALDEAFARRRRELFDDFAFVACCNIGTEDMPDEDAERLRRIAKHTWVRHFDDTLGLSHGELKRRQQLETASLPALEPLLADKPEHMIPRTGGNPLGERDLHFQVQVPEHLYNNGELYNLCIRRGTLNAEERFKINEHIIQTLRMLDRLPFPPSLKRVPEYAGAHHETMLGTGYPRKLTKKEMSVPARIMAIADIFEALTASDRPYKKAKPLSVTFAIMRSMAVDGHIDVELFRLFVESPIWLEYSVTYLAPEQIDVDDARPYLEGV